MATVLRYRDHVATQKYLESIFEKYDEDKSGKFESHELPELLRACAPEGCEVEETDAACVQSRAVTMHA
jgi:Ca2+-binding EF-hand superfamily protein